MTIKLRYFAWVRERVGKTEEDIEVPSGVGTVGGTLIGALILGGLRNGLTLMNVQSFWQQVASGLVIIFAVLIDKLIRRAA